MTARHSEPGEPSGEHTPEHNFQISGERYTKAVKTLLDDIFIFLPERIEERVPVPNGVEHRWWVLESDDLTSTQQFGVTRLSPMASESAVAGAMGVRLLRVQTDSVIHPDHLALRNYEYFAQTDELFVTKAASSMEELQNYRLHSQESLRYREAVQLEMDLRISQANDVDRLDFLRDLESYRKTLKS